MITKSATVTDRSETRARIFEFGVRGGLNIGHLRAFVEQADIAGLSDAVPVHLTDKLQSSSAYHDVEITASVSDSTVSEIAAAPTQEVGRRDVDGRS